MNDLRINPLILASVIYGPSCISFQKALEWHGLIPERVPVITCATYGKNRNKKFFTPLGTFAYTDIPPRAYPMGVDAPQDGEDLAPLYKKNNLALLVCFIRSLA